MEEKRRKFFGYIYDTNITIENLSKILSDLYSLNIVEYAILVYHIYERKEDFHIHFAINFKDKRSEESVEKLCKGKFVFLKSSMPYLLYRKYLFNRNLEDENLIFEIGLR